MMTVDADILFSNKLEDQKKPQTISLPPSIFVRYLLKIAYQLHYFQISNHLN